MKFVQKLKEMAGEGLSNFGPQVGAELKRLGTHGAVEAAQGLFNGAGFTPYGPGAYTPTPEQAGPEKEAPAVEMEREQGREM